MDALKKLEGLQNVEAFEQEMTAVNSVEEMQKLLSKYGVEMSAEEIESLAQDANKVEGELNEDALDDVAGGVSFSPWVTRKVAEAATKLVLWIYRKRR